MSILNKARRVLVGKKLDPFDPKTRHNIALIAILAWIGLGADGLSSSCYGPEEAFLALGQHTDIALFLALATAVTVFVIAASYNQVIDLFPSGGGGYKAATKLIGAKAGLISGSALIVDYVLTIAISVASGADALYSLLPASMHGWKLATEALLVVGLMVLNLRGMKESIRVLAPIFLGFVVTHVALIIYGIGAHADAIGTLWPNSVAEAQKISKESGVMFVIALFLRAYSIGGGTYTGIEAVSNNINMLAEPRVKTGHYTMFYMAVSLALMAGGIIMLYLLWDAAPTPGQTLNAVTFRQIIEQIFGSGSTANIALGTVLLLEAGLLMVAANTGFLGGPAVLASMASDRWVPRQFRQLSNRMVTQNGVLVMGIAALLIVLATRGRVSLLVVLYSINVFITFTLTLFGLSRHWWQQRRYILKWKGPLLLSLTGLSVTAFMLTVIVVEKFLLGGWVTLVITGAVAALCVIVRRHYDEVRRLMAHVDQYAPRVSWLEELQSPPLDPAGCTAIVLVGANRGAGYRTLEWVLDKFPGKFRNFVFVAVGEVDRDAFDSARSLAALQARLQNSLAYFIGYCASQNIAATSYESYGADPQSELTSLVDQVFEDYPDSVCFASRIVFRNENLFTSMLHNQLPLSVQRHLHGQGREMIVVPVKLTEADTRPSAPTRPPVH
ncbi:MAG: family permease [Hydrocarboniphaga sp.]|uniref:APC family permease n=1 Tax=Hydrocarboniphaga sp. TaxID=2033016 RepID=UPI002617CF8C|nr:APC family permease [Hydrocarboniphaga sp.]MDB5968304.1 family permease [Hydrocarboniphaga sp.]